MQNVIAEDNVVLGAPAGDQAIAIAGGPNGTTAFSSPRRRVWQWPHGPFNETRPEEDEAETLISTVARPELRQVQAVCFKMHAHYACTLCLPIMLAHGEHILARLRTASLGIVMLLQVPQLATVGA